MMKLWVWTTLPALLALTACATPADVRADHDRLLRTLQDDVGEARSRVAEERAAFADRLADAETWDHHWLGIPAGGWVVIFIVASIVLLVLGGISIYFLAERRRDRRRREHDLLIERERTAQQRVKAAALAIERGTCQVCGAAPVPDDLLDEVRKKASS